MQFVRKQLQYLQCFATATVRHSSCCASFRNDLCGPALSFSLTPAIRPANTFRYVHIPCLPELFHRLPYHRFCWCWTSKSVHVTTVVVSNDSVFDNAPPSTHASFHCVPCRLLLPPQARVSPNCL
jgi:hypothetical protein